MADSLVSRIGTEVAFKVSTYRQLILLGKVVKKMKKIIALMTAILFVLGISAVSFAADMAKPETAVKKTTEDKGMVKPMPIEEKKAAEKMTAKEKKAAKKQAAKEKKAAKKKAAEEKKAAKKQAAEEKKAAKKQAAGEKKAMEEKPATKK
jgi:hypothetical protein